jgi:hypothetical protein
MTKCMSFFPDRLLERRKRISDLSWFMRSLCEKIETVENGARLRSAVQIGGGAIALACRVPRHGKVKSRVSRASALLFLDWTNERMTRVKIDDRVKREEVLEPHLRAQEYWASLVEMANAD